MGSRIECFMIERTDLARRSLRRYRASNLGKCPRPMGYHDAEVTIEATRIYVSKWEGEDIGRAERVADNDQRWPISCACGYAFVPDDARQDHLHRLYRDTRSGALLVLAEAAPGAMWFGDYYADDPWGWKGADGRCVVVKLPDGTDWIVDGPAGSGSV